MDIIGLKKIISLDEAWEIAVPSGKTVEVIGQWVPLRGFSAKTKKSPSLMGFFSFINNHY
jgi:hypothetical protein